MPTWAYILIGLVIAVVVFFVVKSLKKKAGDKKPDPGTGPQKRFDDIVATLTHETPAIRGVFPFVKSRSVLPDQVYQGIKDAFVETHLRAHAIDGFTASVDPADCKILVFPSVRDFDANGNYSPAFQVFFAAGSVYDESEFDKEPGKPGGYTLAAEQVMTVADSSTWTIIPHPDNIWLIAENNSYEYTKNVTSCGLEHILAYKHSLGFYLQTRDHVPSFYNNGNPVSHPIF